MSLKGVSTGGQGNPMVRGSFRVPWIQPEGATAAFIHEAKIVDINMATWTVDVRTQFDRRFFLNIQVMTPYCHPNSGEGVYMFPELGAKCLIAIPSDGPPPVVIGFIMPATTISDVGTDDAPFGTTPATAVDATAGRAIAFSGSTYSGGRPRPKPGDIYMKGRDGNFCIMHRGGVLQIGSTALAQRLYIPINNIVTDISQNYHHYNTGGAISWAVSTADSETTPPTTHTQTFRLHATEKNATVRVSVGTIKSPVGIKVNEVGQSDVSKEAIGAKANPIIYEVVISPEDIEADTGANTGTTQASAKMQFAFDSVGGGYLWSAGSIVFATKKKLIVRADDNISISTKKSLVLKGEQDVTVDGGSLLTLTGKVVKIGAGTQGVAFVGSSVVVQIPPGLLIAMTATGPAPVVSALNPAAPASAGGAILNGRANVLV